MNDEPIGMFDSGVGGLTVARSLIDLLPAENLLYLGDTARGPYGPRLPAEVRAYALEITDWLVDQGVKLVVVACNTAAAAALEAARERFPVPIIGVVEPGVRAALAVTTSRRIGVIGTPGTIDSGAYERALAALQSPGRRLQIASPRWLDTALVSLACPRFVEFVERGVTSGPEVAAHVAETLAPLRVSGIDALVLGCTHYPLLARTISDAAGRDVTLISSADETAFEVLDILERTGMRRMSGTGTHRFVVTGDTEQFRRLGERFLGPEVAAVEGVNGLGAW